MSKQSTTSNVKVHFEFSSQKNMQFSFQCGEEIEKREPMGWENTEMGSREKEQGWIGCVELEDKNIDGGCSRR